jgi:hypothetical protein
MYRIHLKLLSSTTLPKVSKILLLAKERKSKLSHLLKVNKNEKLRKLQLSRINQQNATESTYDFKSKARLVNLSGTTLTKSEEKILCYGPKFAHPPAFNPGKLKDTVIADIAATTGNETRMNLPNFKSIVDNFQNSVPKMDGATKVSIFSLKKKIKDNQLVIAKADKCDSLVVLKEADYNEKVLTFLNENNATLYTRSFNYYNKEKVRKAIREVIQDNKKLKDSLYVIHPSPPSFMDKSSYKKRTIL